MTRTTLIAFPVTLFFAWWMYVVTRAGNGPGFRWDRVPDNVKFTVAVTIAFYLLFVLVALTVLYFTRVRGHDVNAGSLLLPALARFAIAYALAIVIASVLGELFAVADERSFNRETTAFLAKSVPDATTHDMPLYSRKRWWPAGAQLLVSPDSTVTRH